MAKQVRQIKGEGEIKIIINSEENSPTLVRKRGLVKIGGKWFAASDILGGGDSLLGLLLNVCRGGLTTAKICQFLEEFGLTLGDLAKEKPEETISFVRQICAELVNWCTQNNIVSPRSSQHIKQLRDNLNQDSLPELRQILDQTIKQLEELA